MVYTEEDCIEALQEAKSKIGHSPSRKEYRELEISPSDSTISENLGSWNKAKNKAGLETKEQKSLEEIPEHLDITQEEWKQMPRSTRYYHRNRDEVREKLRENNKERRQRARKYVKNKKKKSECKECGEDRHPDLLEYHHKNEEQKKAGISELVQLGKPNEKIEEEIKKCELLCANCHRLKHT